jgi:hypothetical protein
MFTSCWALSGVFRPVRLRTVPALAAARPRLVGLSGFRLLTWLLSGYYTEPSIDYGWAPVPRGGVFHVLRVYMAAFFRSKIDFFSVDLVHFKSAFISVIYPVCFSAAGGGYRGGRRIARRWTMTCTVI